MDKIITAIQMQFKTLRIYLLQLFLVVFVMPFLCLGGASLKWYAERLCKLSAFWLHVSTLISTFLAMLALSITNLRQKEVLELYSTYAVNVPGGHRKCLPYLCPYCSTHHRCRTVFYTHPRSQRELPYVFLSNYYIHSLFAVLLCLPWAKYEKPFHRQWFAPADFLGLYTVFSHLLQFPEPKYSI